MSREVLRVARLPLVLLVAAALLAGAVSSWGPRMDGREEKPRKRFTLVYNVNNAGYIDVCGCKRKEVRQGSLTRRASFLKQLRSTGRDLLILDGGSVFFPINERIKPSERPDAIRKAKLIVEAYNRIGYRAMAVGAHDLVEGLDVLLELRKGARFEMLSANLIGADGKTVFQPHAVFEVAGTRIGVIGLTLDTIPERLLQQNAPGCRIEDPIAAAKRSVEELSGRTDILIALSYLRDETNEQLAKELAELQIVVDPYLELGSQKTWLQDESEWLRRVDDKLILRSDGQGARLGVVDIEIVEAHKALLDGLRFDELADLVEYDEATPQEKQELTTFHDRNLFRFQRASLDPHVLTDPDIDLLIDEFRKGTDPAEAKRLEQGLPKKNEFATVDRCKSCHEKQYEWWKGTTHSHAYETLRKTGDHQRFDCVGCHSLGYGQAWLDTTSVGSFADVQCESCHGTNPAHLDAPEKNPFPRITKQDCLVCHNKEQTRTEFQYSSSRRRMTCPKG